MIDVKIGQDVWIRPGGLYKNEDIKKQKIKKIGRKYLTIDDYHESKFCKNTGKEKYKNYQKQLYLSLQEIKDEDENDMLFNKIKNMFNKFPKVEFDLDKLRAINNIMNENCK